MNSAGLRRPRCGCRQRTSASNSTGAAAGIGIEQRLVVELELVARDGCAAPARGSGEWRCGSAAARRRSRSARPRRSGGVHRHVGVAQQHLSGHRGGPGDRNPDAHAEVHIGVAVDGDRHVDGVRHPVGHERGLCGWSSRTGASANAPRKRRWAVASAVRSRRRSVTSTAVTTTPAPPSPTDASRGVTSNQRQPVSVSSSISSGRGAAPGWPTARSATSPAARCARLRRSRTEAPAGRARAGRCAGSEASAGSGPPRPRTCSPSPS
jgi:hypothetical protein